MQSEPDREPDSPDILHDLGAISIMSSDSQAMGRVGEVQNSLTLLLLPYSETQVITRTWQTAHKMKEQRGHLPEDEKSDDDNVRVKR